MSASLAARPLAVILASTDVGQTLRPNLERWFQELDDGDELIVVDASGERTAAGAAEHFPPIRLLRRPAGALAPELWREGLEATDAPLVAFSTTRMYPAPGWRRAVLASLEGTGAAAVGGPIAPAPAGGPGRDPLSRAVYLLRFVAYLPPLIAPASLEPPGDNGVYRRDRLAGLEPLWESGFWEVEIHRALRARGERVVMSETGTIVFSGANGFWPLLCQRYKHARHYGAGRARRLGWRGRLARILAMPLVPLVLLLRIVAALRARRLSLLPWMPALPLLLPLLAAWSLGEAWGMGAGLPSARRSPAVTRSPIHRLRGTCETRRS